MEKFFDRLGEILSADPGGRGLLGHLTRQDPSKAVRLLTSANKTFIVTGFPIASAGVGENDGPVGAASLAYALCRAGKQAYIVTDSWSERIVKACLKALGCAAPVVCLECGGPGEISSIASRLRPYDEEALETITARRIKANPPACAHAAVHECSTVNHRWRHEQRHGRTGAHAQHHVAHRRHIRLRPRHGLTGIPIESLDMNLSFIREECIEIERHYLVGPR